MGFPIVVGAKSVSSRPLSLPSPIEEYSTDGVNALTPVVLKCGGPRVAMAVNNQGSLCAAITISYYDMIRPADGFREMTVIDLKVTISPTSSGYSVLQHRELLHRIPIPDSSSSIGGGDDEDNEDAEEHFLNEVRASVVFSSDGLNLDCLIPCPRKGRSVLLNLQLRKPLEKHQKSPRQPPPPLPSYLSPIPPSTTTSSTMIVPVATNPRLVKDTSGIPVSNVISICDASTVPVGQQQQQRDDGGLGSGGGGPPSVLLAGCMDGSILAIGHSHRRAPIAASVVTASPFIGESIVCMKHSAEHGSNDESSWGKLVTIRTNGTAAMFTTHLVWAESSKYEDDEEAMAVEEPPPTQVTSNLSNRPPDPSLPMATKGRSVVVRENSTQSESLLIKIDSLTVLERSLASATFCNAQWINGHILALLVRPRIDQKDTVQVWAIYENQSPQRLSTLQMTAERLEEDSHGTFHVGNNSQEENDPVDDEHDTRSSCTTSNSGPLALHYDIDTGCLAVSSLLVSRDSATSVASNGRKNGFPLTGKPYVCIWHWLTDVVGITLIGRNFLPLGRCKKSLISCLHFSSDLQKERRRRLVHTVAWLPNVHSSRHRIRKEMYPLATLSPSTSFKTNDGCNIQEASSLMLSSDSVSLPFVSTRSSNDDREVEWVESCVPSAYTSKFGPLQIATIGQRNGNSVAVASSRGICVLRTSPELRNAPKWRLFGSPSEEKEFKVITMTWWEMNYHDDLLVAVIKSESSGYNLCCWSPRALDFESQLLVSTEILGTKEDQHLGTKGLRLPSGFKPSQLSLLAEPPSEAFSEDIGGESSLEPRAILMLSSSERCVDGECDYAMFRLQLTTTERIAKFRQPKQLQYSNVAVACQLSSFGKFRLHHWSHEGTCSSIFIAGGSFQFDLGNSPSSEENEHENDLIATVGIIRTPGLGVDTIVVSSAGPVECANVIAGVGSETQARSSQVSKFWLSDMLGPARRQSDQEYISPSTQGGNFFVWVFELCDGRLLSWSVPYFGNSCDRISFSEFEQDALDALIPETTSVGFDNELLPPTAVGGSEASGFLMGIACAIGDSSTWMNDSSSANRSEFTMGSIPESDFGCILSAGQNARKLHRVVPGGQDSMSFATNFLDHEVFSVGDLILMPPAFMASLFASFLGLAGSHIPTNGKKNAKVGSSSVSDLKKDMFKNHCVARLYENPNKDSAMMALRLLILRTVESLSERAKKNNSQKSMMAKRSFAVATALFSEVIDAAKYSVTPLQFASLILGVGRQVEPHCLQHLFPLPSSVDCSSGPDNSCPHYKWRTVDDLYTGAVRSGSLGISASALPLCLAKTSLQRNCAALLIHCLECLSENTESESVILFDTSREERQSIGDLFRYGMKLEDAELVNSSESNPDVAGSDDWLTNGGAIDYMNTSTSNRLASSTDESFQIVSSNQLRPQPTSSRSRSLLRIFLPFFWKRDTQKRLEEDAIYEAASSFILSGFEELEIDNFLGTDQNPPAGVETNEKGSSRGDYHHHKKETQICTVSDVVDEFLVSTLLLDQSSSTSRGSANKWKRACAVARLILGDKHTPLTTASRELGIFRKLSTDITIGDLSYALQGYITASTTTMDSSNSSSSSGAHANETANANNGWTTTSPYSPSRRRHRHNHSMKKEHQPHERRIVGNFVVCQILECQYEIGPDEASLLVDLIVILFSRHSTWDGKYKLPQLLILGTIAAHVAQRQCDFFGIIPNHDNHNDDNHHDDYEEIETFATTSRTNSCAMEKCYEYASEELTDTI